MAAASCRLFILQLWVYTAWQTVCVSAGTCAVQESDQVLGEETEFLQYQLSTDEDGADENDKILVEDAEFLQYQMSTDDQTEDPHRLTSNIDTDKLGHKVVHFPAAVWIGWAIFYVVTIFHEVHVARGGSPLLAHPVPQKSMGIQILALWGWAQGFIAMSVQIPLSLDYALAMGQDATMSGVMLSLSGLSGLLGAIIGKVICPEENWNQSRNRRFLVLVPQFSTVIFIFIMWALQWVAGKGEDTRKQWWWILLILMQFGAVMAGMCAMPSQIIWNKCTPQKDKTFWMMLSQAAKQLGLAIGPGVGALMTWGVQGDGPRVSPVSLQAWVCVLLGAQGAISAILAMVTCPTYIPEISEIADQLEVSTSNVHKLEPAPEDLDPHEREQMVWALLWYSFERPLTLGSVEVATVMLLEVQYGWSRETTGVVFTIIAAMGTVLSLVSAIGIKHRLFPESKVLFMGGIGGVLGCVLLFDLYSSLGLVTLLIADPLIYGSALTACGIAEGWASRAAMPGTSYSFEAYRIRDVLLNTLSRMIAPTLARFIVDMGGRNCYAAVQSLAVALAFRTLMKVISFVWNHDSKRFSQGKGLFEDFDRMVGERSAESHEASLDPKTQRPVPQLTAPISWSSWTPRTLPDFKAKQLSSDKGAPATTPQPVTGEEQAKQLSSDKGAPATTPQPVTGEESPEAST
eukprot:TRINITY_DN10110_c0_g1_i1.p1 TRINITY_DN10110_c0_g1~~TRINITY_DN10110_c0_g1_i1.p1  ORF type:complete len:686 (+),score=97.19 TRINITY_DN10110_c0_g1_i1:48-2105(+)